MLIFFSFFQKSAFFILAIFLLFVFLLNFF